MHPDNPIKNIIDINVLLVYNIKIGFICVIYISELPMNTSFTIQSKESIAKIVYIILLYIL